MGSRLEENSKSVRKRIESHTFEDEEGEEYKGSKFGGFPEYFRRKKIKLQNLDVELRSASADQPKLFKGIVAHVNGYTQPSLNDLHRLIVTHGGGFMQYLDGKTTVTHIVAANLTPKKAVEFKRYRIVKPAWIVDSVNSGKLLPWENYRVVDEGVGQKLLGFDGGKIVSQANTNQSGYRGQTNTSWYTGQVKGIAENIDDIDGAQFPSTQRAPSDSNYLTNPSDVPDLAPDQPDLENKLVLSNPESYDATSSLEDAFSTAANVGQAVPEEQDDIYEAELEYDSANANDLVHPELRGESPVSATHLFSAEWGPPSKPSKPMTAEEHNAILLSDPHIRNSSSANPEFLKQFYAESRLHHLSAWKAELKARVQQMAAERSLSQKQAQKRRPGSRRYVMHVDFDSFFCSISLKSAPQYADKPTVVAHGSGPGSEIASCNYPARAFGIKNGMWMRSALKMCPDIKVLPYDFPAYEKASDQFYQAIFEIGGIVQSVSIDEALIDVTTSCVAAPGSHSHDVSEESIRQEQEKADAIAFKLRERIKDRTGCAVSVGIGGNILLAKVALRRAKPAGQHQIKPEEVLDFVGGLALQDLPGVAYSIGGKMKEIGVKFVKDVRTLSKERLINVLGPKTGEKIWEYSLGIDRTEVGEQSGRKSVSAEVNWGIRFISQLEAEEFVQKLCGELRRRLVEQGVKGRHLTMKIMRRAADAPMDPPKSLGHGSCDTFNKSVVLGVATNSDEIIGREAISILRSYGFSPGELRGLGVQMTKLEPLKGGTEGGLDGSQRRINFSAKSKMSRQDTDDPIIDPESPLKVKVTPVHPVTAIARANAADGSAKKPLNISGTQFLIPSQIDPAVLAELPTDIRSRLLAQDKSNASSRDHSPVSMSRSQSPMLQAESTFLPSQLDPEVFDALPEDVKVEVLASYSSRAQRLLPHTPRKVRAIATKKQITPTKKRKGLLFGTRSKQNSNSTLTQSNFMTSRRPEPTKLNPDQPDQPDQPDPAELSELDPDFLAALPEEMRREVVAEHRRSRLAIRSGLVTASMSAAAKKRSGAIATSQRRLKLPARAERPTFTTAELSTLPELRETLGDWYEAFREEGPHGDDVRAMERYLRRVVLEERDMGKAVDVVRWLEWLVEDEERAGRGKSAWREAVGATKAVVQEAVAERGIGKVEF